MSRVEKLRTEPLARFALARAKELLDQGRLEDALGFLERAPNAVRNAEGRDVLWAIIRRCTQDKQWALIESAAKRFRESGHTDSLLEERLRLARECRKLPPAINNSGAVRRLLEGAPRGALRLPLLPGLIVTCLRPYYRRDDLSDEFSALVRLHKKKPLGEVLGYLLAEHIRRNTHLLLQTDLIVPVPPDPERSAQRGFYPVGLLAGWTARYLALPCRELLRKGTGTVRSYQATLEDLRRALSLADPHQAARLLGGRGVLLVDDVIRSGQTARVCLDLIAKAAAIPVGVATLAYVEGYGRFSIWDDLAATPPRSQK